jgi:hypothetical protein
VPIIDELKILASKEINPLPPSWALVFYLLIKNDSSENANLGATVAASGEASIFSYSRDSIEPMYYCTIGGSQRLKVCTGYEIKCLRTTDAEKAFSFLRDGIDTGQGIFMAGPEVGLCYGYDDPGKSEDRTTYGFTNWGPAFTGNVSWDRFLKYVEMFGEAEGFAYITSEIKPEPVEKILDMICKTVVDWQNEHPATEYGIEQSSYGLSAFRNFIDDVLNPEIRSQVDEAYINCHVIQFQSGGRYWLGHYLKEVAQHFSGETRNHIEDIGNLYIKVHSFLNKFIELNINDGETESEILDSVEWLEKAYQLDEIILDKFISLRKVVQI